MCYVCRASVTGYDHFCQHFRAGGTGTCTQCTKCHLYKSDDTPHARAAAEDALRQSALTPAGFTAGCAGRSKTWRQKGAYAVKHAQV